mmetsp:Transcript_55194/g.76544  ORF Transcript_55194/g.76544 Transcript_55194/m.76544 type:complete len:89 (+) Transcript_55194:1006-1272(+)
MRVRKLSKKQRMLKRREKKKSCDDWLKPHGRNGQESNQLHTKLKKLQRGISCGMSEVESVNENDVLLQPPRINATDSPEIVNVMYQNK